MEVLTRKKIELNVKELEERVKNMYSEVARFPENTFHFEMGRDLALRLGYPAEKLNQIPKEAIESFAGVGYYFDLLQLQKGETVVDLGSGSGMDMFYAARQVGSAGKVVGVDMTAEQLMKSSELSSQYDFNNVFIQEGHIEHLPLVSEMADAVISNGVINLSAQKENVFKEIARVLKKGGRMAISDIVTSSSLPDNISCNATLWAACIGGAMQKDEYFRLIEKAGLTIVFVKENPYEFISKSAKNASEKYGIKSLSILAVK